MVCGFESHHRHHPEVPKALIYLVFGIFIFNSGDEFGLLREIVGDLVGRVDFGVVVQMRVDVPGGAVPSGKGLFPQHRHLHQGQARLFRVYPPVY